MPEAGLMRQHREMVLSVIDPQPHTTAVRSLRTALSSHTMILEPSLPTLLYPTALAVPRGEAEGTAAIT